MPTQEETKKVEPLVLDLMKDDQVALKSGKKTRVEVAESAMALADKADSEAAKLLLMKGAFNLYVRAGEFDKAIETLQALQAAIPDIPPANMANIIEASLRVVSRKNGGQLYRLLEETKTRMRYTSAAKKMEKALKENPNDRQLRTKLAEHYAYLGKWDKALENFIAADGKAGVIAKAEQGGEAGEKAADFWWSYPTGKADELVKSFRTHAAKLYEDAIADGKITGLNKVQAERRIEEMSKEITAADKILCTRDSTATEKIGDHSFPSKIENGKRRMNGNMTLLSADNKSAEMELCGGSFIVNTAYVVGKGYHLSIDKGTEIIFTQGASMIVDGGSLSVKGTSKCPVVLRGQSPMSGYWKGLVLKDGAQVWIEGLSVSDAEVALYAWRACPIIMKSTFSKNIIGVKIGMTVKFPGAELTDCLISDNKEDGFYGEDQGLATLNHCSVLRNGGWGIAGPFKFAANVSDSTIEANQCGGYYTGRFGTYGVPEAHVNRSVISNKGRFEIKVENSNQWDFKSNYWGEKRTAELKAKRADALSACIFDCCDAARFGRVIVDDFLMKRPQNCGVRDCPHNK